jgi:spore maturation protein CgeB
MSFKLLTISSMYPGYLGSFYTRFGNLKNLSYDEHYNLLLNDTTEFAGAYTRTFCKIGADATFVVANDSILQGKWKSENVIKAKTDVNILFEQVRKIQPEVLWIEDLNHTDINFLKAIKTSVKSVRLILAYYCSPFSQKIYERLNYVDFVITCTPGLKQEMENKGFRSYLVYHGFDKELLPRIAKEKTFPQNNFVFSGSLSTGEGYHENILKADIDLQLYVNLEKIYKIRAKQSLFFINEFLKKAKLEKIIDYFPVLQYGQTAVRNYSDALLNRKTKPVFGIEMYRMLNNSRVVLNMHIGAAGSYAGNMRLFEATGVGSCILTDYKDNLGDLFEINSQVVAYKNIDDCIDKAKWLLANEDERRKIASAGQKRTLTSHTVENRCHQIMQIIIHELNT